MLKKLFLSLAAFAGVLLPGLAEDDIQWNKLLPKELDGALVQVSQKFVKDINAGDADALKGRVLATGVKDRWLEEFKGVREMIVVGVISVSTPEKELVIGDLGVTLLRIEKLRPEQFVRYVPMIWVRVDGSWNFVPWTNEKELHDFAKTRSAEEQIHIKLMDKWADEIEKLLAEEAKVTPAVE